MSLIDLASLVLAPTATKEGKVYSAIPDTGDGDMTFTRGSSATRVNSAGLIEKERANLLTYSNDLSNAAWTKTRGSVSGNKWIPDTQNDYHNIGRSATIQNGSVYAWSIEVKADGYDFVLLNIVSGVGTNSGPIIDLTDGSVVGNFGGYTHNAVVESVEDGYYRVKMWFLSTTTSLQLDINPLPTSSVAKYSGDNTKGILVRKIQLEQGLVSTDYIETTTTAVYEGITDDVPRVDYSGGGCPSLLLEGQRTNVVTNSEYIASITDLTNGDGTITSTSNYAISPEGVKNATRIQASATGSNYAVKSYTAPSSVSGNYTCSMYIKSNTSSNQSINFYARGGNNVITVTPEWQRFVVVGVGSTNFINFGVTQASGQENIDILCYGLQMEQDVTYSTSYLPTYGTSTTRVADSCSKTGISELIGQTEGTIFCEGTIVAEDSTSNRRLISISDGSTANAIQIFNRVATEKLEADCNVSGVSQFSIQSGDVGYDTPFKFALAYKENDIAFYVNGSQIGTDSSASIPSTSKIAFSRGDDNFKHEGGIKQAILFPTALTDDQCIALTK